MELRAPEDVGDEADSVSRDGVLDGVICLHVLRPAALHPVLRRLQRQLHLLCFPSNPSSDSTFWYFVYAGEVLWLIFLMC